MPPKKKQVDNTAMRELKQAVKAGAPKRLYLFYGEETFLRDDCLDLLKKAVLPPGMEDFNLHTARGKDQSVDWIEQAVDYLPMMSERTLVLVTDFDLFGLGDAAKERLIGILSHLPDYCCLVFVYDLLAYKPPAKDKLAALLKKEGALVNFQRQEQKDLAAWICRQFEKAGKSVSTPDAEYLIFLAGDLMHDLSAEIGKAAAYAAHPRVTRADMDAVVIPKVEAVVYQMTDAMARKDFDKAASVLADLLHSREAPAMILSAMGKYFQQLYAAKLYLDAGRGRDDLKALWELKTDFQASRLTDAARGFSMPWCKYALRRCYETDIVMKNSYGQEGEVLTALLMELAAG